MKKNLIARAPAKLIISGEHSVVYGMPAIAVAIEKYTQTTASINSSPSFIFKLLNLQTATIHTIQALKSLKQRLMDDYQDFLNGNCNIKDVVKKPFELLQFSVTNLIEKLNLQLSNGLEIQVNSSIPIGCGLGSSSAAVVSTLFAVINLLGIKIDPASFLLMGKEAENLQHGKSSGLDLYLSTYGGCRAFKQGEYSNLNIPEFHLYMVNTGIPQSSTGECVAYAERSLKKDTIFAEEFRVVTDYIHSTMQNNDFKNFQYGIKENHKLLKSIGVVPEKINNFISDIENIGGAGKICGAGSVKGDSGGIALLAGDKELLSAIADKYGYRMEQLTIDTRGAHVI